MKSIVVAVFAVALSVGISYAAEPQSRLSFGSYYDANTPTETVVTVSSTAVTTSSAVNDGVFREFMNTGTTNIARFVVLSSSNTSGMTYIAPGAIWVEDMYFGNYYFKAAAGGNSTLATKTYTNK